MNRFLSFLVDENVNSMWNITMGLLFVSFFWVCLRENWALIEHKCQWKCDNMVWTTTITTAKRQKKHHKFGTLNKTVCKMANSLEIY